MRLLIVWSIEENVHCLILGPIVPTDWQKPVYVNAAYMGMRLAWEAECAVEGQELFSA